MENQISDLFVKVSGNEFKESLKRVQSFYKVIRESTTPWNEIEIKDVAFFIAGCPAFMGFAISENGELTSVFSSIKGKGDTIMKEAIKQGAKHLDCFDGYLPTFYARHGFQEVRREKNWTEGEPDVVYMEKN